MSPTEVLLFAVVVLFALGIGMLIPVLLELRRTLQVVRERLDETSTRFVRSLDEVDKTAAHLNHFADELIENEKEGVGLIAASKEASEALRTLSQGLRKATSLGMAVGPAVVAFISTLREMNAVQEKDAGGNDADDAQEDNDQNSANAVPPSPAEVADAREGSEQPST